MAFYERLAHLGHASHNGLERLFRERVDPWRFGESAYEQQRFSKMAELVRSVPHGRILEVGCAEGHFTERLLTVSDDVTAIEPSSEAIARARVRAPAARFLAVKLEDLTVPAERYDVVVCGEMLYYVEDMAIVVAKLRQIGTYLVTSTCYPSAVFVHRKLSSCRLIRKLWQTSVSERKAASIRLWEL